MDEKKNKKIGRIWLAATVIIAVFGGLGIAWIFRGNLSFAIMGGVNMAVILAVLSFTVWILWNNIQKKKAGLAVEDERTRRIAGRAAQRALLVGGWFMLALLWYDWFQGQGIIGGLELNAAWALILSILANSGLFLLLRWYYGRREYG